MRIFRQPFTRFVVRATATATAAQRNEVKTAIFTALYHAREPRIDDVDHETLPRLRYNKKKKRKGKKKKKGKKEKGKRRSEVSECYGYV